MLLKQKLSNYQLLKEDTILLSQSHRQQHSPFAGSRAIHTLCICPELPVGGKETLGFCIRKVKSFSCCRMD